MTQSENKTNQESTPAQIAKEKALLVKTFWDKQPGTLKFIIIGMLILVIAALSMLATLDKSDMRTLYSNLALEDASSIAEFVKSRKIEYQLEDSGTRILVPSQNVHELRLELAQEGLPAGGAVGFELFDKQKFGMTEFEEQVSMRRALEGELARTITRLDIVKNAKANLVLPRRSLLGARASEASASIVLELHRGRELGQGTINAITHLVSSSVEALSPERVTIVDTHGKLLSSRSDIGSAGSDGLQFQRKFETQMQESIEQMLERLLGPGRSITRVSADFDFSKSEIQEEKYDPSRVAVRSERRELEVTGNQFSEAEGIPGTRANLPGAEAPGINNERTGTRKELETKNWEIDRVIKKIIAPGSELKRVSVSVMVDGEQSEEDSFVPRSAEELRKIELAVKGAIGFSEVRGDIVTIQSIPFHQPEHIFEELDSPVFNWKEYLPMATGLLVILLGFFSLIMFTKSSKLRSENNTYGNLPKDALSMPRPLHEIEAMLQNNQLQGSTEARGQLPGYVNPSEEMPDMSVFNMPPGFDEYANKTSELMHSVKNVFEDDSETAARIISAWIHDQSQTPEQKPMVSGNKP